MQFENRYSVIWLGAHFLLGVVCSWLVFDNIVAESRANRYDAHLTKMRTENVLYREKARYLEDELRSVRADNDRLLIWLQTKPDSIPYYEKQIESLTHDKQALNDKISLLQKKLTPSGWTAIPPTEEKSRQDLYAHTEKIKVGESINDKTTGVGFALTEVKPDFSAEINLRLPGAENKQIVGVKAGASWMFEVDGSKYRLGMRKVDWFSQTAEVEIIQVSIK